MSNHQAQEETAMDKGLVGAGAVCYQLFGISRSWELEKRWVMLLELG